MPSLKDLKNRIASVTSTRKITKAMQMVAAAKLRRAQEAAVSARPYADRMSAVMSNLVSGVGDSESAPRLLAGSGHSDVHLLILATSERGLCGGFNSSIVRLAKSHIADLQNSGKTVKIITVGKKGREQIKRDYADLMINHVDLSEVKRLGYGNAKSIADDVLARFSVEEFDICTIFYNEFKSVISQVPTALQLIPAVLKETANIDNSFYEYEPDETEILAELLPRAMSTQIFTALLENGASEQGARMSAMDSATRNAGDMIDKLTIEYNRSRQAVITNELIEIISGAEAL
ncbi:F0F1 ATP synthase subunit gamma [Paracoccaceae bacterium]|jgi:F-type H+-transporting ATPase subunit gamma|nr:F0F1 ATP synthase subunit gamma [Paracoccaceae bacterium]MDA9122875.1 F0F1 ATP synthase subunit gamma [Paracoccaceae bacterium]|tara:strand:- start:19173 stop:20045 length:873 start_codon:yes stop_codon:yes gene_type:complete